MKHLLKNGFFQYTVLVVFLLALIVFLVTSLHADYIKEYNEAVSGEQLYAVESYTLDDGKYRVFCENDEVFVVSTIQFDPDCDGVYVLVEKREEPYNVWQTMAYAFSMSSRKRLIYNITLVMGVD